MYLSPSTWHFYQDSKTYGCMLNCTASIGGQDEALANGAKWALDNGQFKERWTWASWYRYLVKFLPFIYNCLFVILPDKVGDAILTLYYFKVFSPVIKEFGYPVALATQDGMKIENIPWSDIDVLFIGGTDYHKRGKEAELLGLEAKRLGKWVHIGRVQSGGSMLKYWPWADSFDGTTLIKHKTQQMPSITSGIARIAQGKVPYTSKLL